MRAISRHSGAILTACALASLVLGTTGFLTCDPAIGFATAFYRSFQLFYWNYFPWNTTLEATLPWTLEAARWLAPIVTLSALSRVIVALFHRKWEAFRARRMRGHTVICGAGEKGAALARDMRSSGDQALVLIEKNEMRAGELAAEGFLVVRGDGAKTGILDQAAVQQAGRLVIATGNDHDNLAIAMAAAHLAGGPLQIHAHSGSATLSDLYRRNRAVTASHGGGSDIRVFNHFRNVARRTMAICPPEPSDGSAHVILPDLTPPATALAIEYALVGHFTGGRRVHLHIIGPTASPDLEAFRARYPSIDRCAEISATDIPPGDRFATRVAALAAGLPGDASLTVFPGFAEANEALTHALELLELTQTPAGLKVLLPGSMGAPVREMIGANNALAARIGFLPPLADTCGYEAVVGGTLDRTACAIHENWLKETRLQIEAARAAGNGDLARSHEDKATFKPWDALSEEQKGASRSQADHIPFKIRAAGLDPVTVTPADWARLSSGQIETLARMEHARWAAYYWMTGWTFDPVRDDARKRHPNLVPYDDLDEPTKDYDRLAVRNLADYLRD